MLLRAAQNGGTEPDSYQFLLKDAGGNVAWDSGWVAGTSACQVGTPLLGSGRHTWLARAAKGGQASGWTGEWAFHINAVPPQPPLLSPTGDTWLNASTVTLTVGAVADPDAHPDPVTYTFEARKEDGSWTRVRPGETSTTWTVGPLTDGRYLWRAAAGDGWDHNGFTPEAAFRLDTVSPVPALPVPDPATPGNGSMVAVGVSGTDSYSGVATLTLAVDGTPVGSVAGPNGTVTWDAIAFAEGVHVLRVRATDAAGNTADGPPLNYRIDRTPPVTTHTFTGTLGANGWYTSKVRVTLNATDLSGVRSIHYAFDEGAFKLYTGPFNMAVDKAYALRYYAVDKANPTGNQEAEKEVELKIDTTPPTPITIVTDPSPTPEGRFFQVHWDGRDTVSKLIAASIAITDNPAAPDNTLTWKTMGIADPATTTGFARLPMALDPGTPYYARVKLRNGAGLWSAATQSTALIYEPNPDAVGSGEGAFANVAGISTGGNDVLRSLIGEPAVTGSGRNGDGEPGQRIGQNWNPTNLWAGLPEAFRTIVHAPPLLFQDSSTKQLGGLYRSGAMWVWRSATASMGSPDVAAMGDMQHSPTTRDGRAQAIAQAFGSTHVISVQFTGASRMEQWKIWELPLGTRLEAVGDFDGDGKADLLTQETATRTLRVYYYAGGPPVGQFVLPAGARVVGVADFDKNGKLDVAYQGNAGTAVRIWRQGLGTTTLPLPGPNDVAGAVSDIDEDGKPDIVYRRGPSEVVATLLDGLTVRETRHVAWVPSAFRLMSGR